MSSASTVEAANDENLCLLRMLNPEVLADPHVIYRALREYEPVHWDPYMHAWVVTSYPEVIYVLTNCSANRTPPPEYLDKLGLTFMKPFAEVEANKQARENDSADPIEAPSRESNGFVKSVRRLFSKSKANGNPA